MFQIDATIVSKSTEDIRTILEKIFTEAYLQGFKDGFREGSENEENVHTADNKHRAGHKG